MGSRHIDITTQFNVGDCIWVPEPYYNWYASKEPYVIQTINIEINDWDIKIVYEVKDCNGVWTKYREGMCFETYDDCKQWCTTQNAGGAMK